jgi:mono/diheme cytochrome c family protein
MVVMPLLGAWFLASMSSDSRSWVLGGSITMTMFMGLGIGASLLIGVYALVGLWYRKLYVNAFTGALLLVLASAATAGGEFIREGVRKPYSIRYVLYANSLRQEELAAMRQTGSVTADPYPLRGGKQYANDQLRLGAKVYRFQCSVCHTQNGANGLMNLTGSWSDDQKRLNIAQLQRTKPFMPPFAGTALEVEALVQLLDWWHAGMPPGWPTSEDPATTARIQAWLDEAGVAPGIAWKEVGPAAASRQVSALVPVAKEPR